MNSSPEAQERAPNATAPYLEATDGRLAETDPADTRFILYERWKGEEARRKAGSPEPQGAGMARAAAEKIEYAEVWGSEDPSDGYDLRSLFLRRQPHRVLFDSEALEPELELAHRLEKRGRGSRRIPNHAVTASSRCNRPCPPARPSIRRPRGRNPSPCRRWRRSDRSSQSTRRP